MKIIDTILIVDEDDIDCPEAMRGCRVNLVLWPASRKNGYRSTKTWAAVYPLICECTNCVYFYEKDMT